MGSWYNYPSIFNLGHKVVKDLFSVPVMIEEKIDGSQFSWCIAEDGEVRVRSKGKIMDPESPEKMFAKAVEMVKEKREMFHKGWTYRGEYLQKPHHNALAYSRVPVGNVIIFDVNIGEEEYLSYEEKWKEAERVGLECVQFLMYSPNGVTLEEFKALLDIESQLGGQKIEGVVIKPRDYDLFGQDKKVLMGKYVSEKYKEVQKAAWKVRNPGQNDILQVLIQRYKTPARWRKGIIHMKERGEWQGSVKDIGPLMKEVTGDIKKEEEQAIKDALFAWGWDHIRRGAVAGLAEWYKNELLEEQFHDDDHS